LEGDCVGPTWPSLEPGSHEPGFFLVLIFRAPQARLFSDPGFSPVQTFVLTHFLHANRFSAVRCRPVEKSRLSRAFRAAAVRKHPRAAVDFVDKGLNRRATPPDKGEKAEIAIGATFGLFLAVE
jgi:hypothetical protein